MMSIMYKVALIIDTKDNWKVNQQIQCFIINIYIYFLNSQIINVCIIFKPTLRANVDASSLPDDLTLHTGE